MCEYNASFIVLLTSPTATDQAEEASIIYINAVARCVDLCLSEKERARNFNGSARRAINRPGESRGFVAEAEAQEVN